MVDTGAPEGIVDLARKIGTLAEQETAEKRCRRRRERVRHGGEGSPLDTRVPRRGRLLEGGDALGPRRGHHRDSGAPECRRVVEAARILEAAGRMESGVDLHALSLDEGRRHAVHGELDAAGARLAIDLLDIEENAQAIGRVTGGLACHAPAQVGLAREGEPRDVIGHERQVGRARHPEGDHADEERHPCPARAVESDEAGDADERGAPERPRHARRHETGHTDPRAEGHREGGEGNPTAQ